MRKILIFILCFCTIFVCFVIPSFADEGMTPRVPVGSTPTDLTGYTVTVPSGWTAPAGYGSFDLEGSINFDDDSFIDGLLYNIVIGRNPYEGTNQSGVIFFTTDTASELGYNGSPAFSIDVTGGAVTNSSLIQWFVNNNATFSGGSEPEPETSSISGGVYHFKTFGYLPDIPNASWSDGEGYSYSYTLAGKLVTTSRTIPFTNFGITFDEYVSASHYTVTFDVTTVDGPVNLATYSVSYGEIELETRSDLKYLVFGEALIGTYNDIEFIRQFLVSGFPDTDTSATDNPWAYILEMIIEALKVDLFGYFSVWDIFTTICGIFIVTWLLKLLAGG